jgi:hypothetical protein
MIVGVTAHIAVLSAPPPPLLPPPVTVTVADWKLVAFAASVAVTLYVLVPAAVVGTVTDEAVLPVLHEYR